MPTPCLDKAAQAQGGGGGSRKEITLRSYSPGGGGVGTDTSTSENAKDTALRIDVQIHFEKSWQPDNHSFNWRLHQLQPAAAFTHRSRGTSGYIFQWSSEGLLPRSNGLSPHTQTRSEAGARPNRP